MLRDIAYVAYGFLLLSITERRSRKNAREARDNAPTSISSRFLCPRPPLLLCPPNQNRHATQAMRDIK